MDKHIEEFRKYLVAEKNASDHTVGSYLTDLGQFQNFLLETGHACQDKAIVLEQIANRRESGKLAVATIKTPTIEQSPVLATQHSQHRNHWPNAKAKRSRSGESD